MAGGVLGCHWFLRMKTPGKASKQPSLLFAQGQLLQALRPQDFQKAWREEGQTTLPTRCCLPPSCFLQEVGKEIKSTSVPSRITPAFRYLKYSVAVEEETEAL